MRNKKSVLISQNFKTATRKIYTNISCHIPKCFKEEHEYLIGPKSGGWDNDKSIVVYCIYCSYPLLCSDLKNTKNKTGQRFKRYLREEFLKQYFSIRKTRELFS